MSQPIRHRDLAIQTAARALERAASYRYRIDDLFRDAVEAAFCAVFKPTETDPAKREAREDRYMQIVRKYTRDEDDQANPHGYEIVREVFPQFFAALLMDVETGPRDFLGEVAGSLGTLAPQLGQFFTPDSIAALMSSLLFDVERHREEVAKHGYTSVMEPACGAGGLLLAQARVMREHGIDITQRLLVFGVDISPLSFQMCSLQLAVHGIPAVVYLGDGLSANIDRDCHDKVATPSYYTRFLPAIREFRNPPTRARRAA